MRHRKTFSRVKQSDILKKTPVLYFEFLTWDVDKSCVHLPTLAGNESINKCRTSCPSHPGKTDFLQTPGWWRESPSCLSLKRPPRRLLLNKPKSSYNVLYSAQADVTYKLSQHFWVWSLHGALTQRSWSRWEASNCRLLFAGSIRMKHIQWKIWHTGGETQTWWV